VHGTTDCSHAAVALRKNNSFKKEINFISQSPHSLFTPADKNDPFKNFKQSTAIEITAKYYLNMFILAMKCNNIEISAKQTMHSIF